jgi:hypothetical protein
LIPRASWLDTGVATAAPRSAITTSPWQPTSSVGSSRRNGRTRSGLATRPSSHHQRPALTGGRSRPLHVVGWSLSPVNDRHLIIAALKKAVSDSRPTRSRNQGVRLQRGVLQSEAASLVHRDGESGRVREAVHGEAGSLVTLSAEPDQAHCFRCCIEGAADTRRSLSGDPASSRRES